ncbi:MAG TPA: hypothetical protein VJ792_07375 [Candidatus Nitrosotalea sp.]|nr:hypothetical protein [Candidatus Nitrosotalea sp.]
MNTRSGGEHETTCAMCGKAISHQKQALTEEIDGDSYTFDSTDCVLFFKKFKSLYGSSFNT